MAKKSVKHYSELTFEEQKKLVSDYKEDKPKAWENLYNQYEKLIAYQVYKYSGYNLCEEDVRSEATIGLLIAAQNYDETKNINFNTYATGCIKIAMHTYISSCGQYFKIATNKEAKTLFYKLRSTANSLHIDLSYQLTEAEYAKLAEKLKVKVKNVKLVHQFLHTMKSLSEADNEEDAGDVSMGFETSGNEFYRDPESICREIDMRMHIYKTWRSLPEKEITIIKEVVFNKMPLNKVGQKLGISGERVRQIKNDILKKLEAEIKKLM